VILFRLLQQFLIAIEQAYQRYDLINVWNLVQILFLNLGMIGLALSGGKTLELMKWQALCSAVCTLAHFFIVKSLLQGERLSLIWDKEKTKQVLHYSAIVWINYIGGILFTRVDRIIVGSILGQSTLGLYGVITDVTIQINLLSGLAVQPIITMLGNSSTENKIWDSQSQQSIVKFLKINVLAVIAFGGATLSLAPFILNILFPNATRQDLLFPFFLASTIYSLYSLGATGYYAVLGIKKIAYICTSFQVASSIASLTLIAILANNLGLIGAILGNSCYISLIGLNFIAMNRIGVSYKNWINWLVFSTLIIISMSIFFYLLYSGNNLSLLVL
jgi:O-antigen/teichoic acid export membrane protein